MLDIYHQYVAELKNELGRKQLAQKTREIDVLVEKHNLSKWQLDKAWVLQNRLMQMGADNTFMFAITEYLKKEGRWHAGKSAPSLKDLAFIIEATGLKDSRVWKEGSGLAEIMSRMFFGRQSGK